MVLLTGWVLCAEGRDELVAVAPVSLMDLEQGRLACPVCSMMCSPTFRYEVIRTDISVMSLRDDRWQPGFLLAPRFAP